MHVFLTTQIKHYSIHCSMSKIERLFQSVLRFQMSHFKKAFYFFGAKEGDCITFSNILFMTRGKGSLKI